MKRKIYPILTLTLALVMLATSCQELEVQNPNAPDRARVISNGDDVESLASALFNSWYEGTHSYNGPQMALATAADNVSCSWGNQAMRDMSWEPRDFAWINTPSYNYRIVTKAFFDRMYSVIGTASDIISYIEGGLDIDGGDGNVRALAFAKFAQGISYANLALVFDKAHIVDQNITVDESVDAASPYQDVAAAAVAYLEDALAVAGQGSFTVPSGWLGTSSDVSSAEFQAIINTYIARTLSYVPRNSTELASVNWAKVKTHADAGITSDFSIVMDNYGNWYQEAGDYLTFSGWGVTDMYVVHMMDPGQPQHWDDLPTFPHPAESTNPVDERMVTDFDYLPSNWFQAARGYYHYSNYRQSRYDDIYVNAIGPLPEIMAAENDMLRAEARVYTGDLAGAAAIINAGTRNTRGNMPDVAAVEADLVNAIHHERHVEMYITGMGLQFFEMRKLDRLQRGTPLHLPLPAEILQLFSLPQPYYSFGTTSQADGINTSADGWR